MASARLALLACLAALTAPAHAQWGAGPSTGGSATKAGAAPQGWSVLLKVDNYATGWKQRSTRLGQYVGAAPGYDAQDLPAMAPFSAPYLTLSFPHPEWGAKAGNYATDFRPLTVASAMAAPSESWTFELRASPVGGTVYLSWTGDPAILKRSTLTDRQTGAVYRAWDPAFAARGIPIEIKNAVQTYIWTLRAY